MVATNRKHHLEIVNTIDMTSPRVMSVTLMTDPIKQIISDLDNNVKKYKMESESTSMSSGNAIMLHS